MRTISRRNRAACSILAMATVLTVGATPAAAQVAGTGGFTSGSGSINTGTGDVTITSNQAVIDWTATGTVTNGVNEFLAPGNALTFSSGSDFAVLNNVSTGTDMLGLNGTVTSSVDGVQGRGSVYFYNPNGIVVGGSSVFNVGSLVLTTSPLLVSGGEFIDANNQVVFQQGLAGASIRVDNGAQINALANSSYVALVAPRVVHNGTINVDGSAALVGAEAARITFSPDGLFDITVDSGTTDANGVVVGGTITGPEAGVGETQRIYAVAVPKNQAMTMVIASGAGLGFDVAGAANVDGNAIVLSSGRNVTDGTADTARSAAMGSGTAGIYSINLGTTSALVASAINNTDFNANTDITMASDVTLIGGDFVSLASDTASGDLTVAGLLTMTGDRTIAAGATGSAAIMQLVATNGGTLTAQQGATLSAVATGAASGTAGVAGGNATGGTINVIATDASTLVIAGDLNIDANGRGGETTVNGADAGAGTGGYINVEARGATGSLSVNGAVFATADGTGGSGGYSESCYTCNGAGADGRGGTVQFQTGFGGGFLTIGDDIQASASGSGGNSRSDTGDGYGGTVTATYSAGGSIQFDGNASFIAWGGGGQSDAALVNGGYGNGGTVKFGAQNNATGGSLTIAGLAYAVIEGYGGDSYGAGTGTGGTGEGGLSDNGGNAGTINFQGGLQILGRGFGGDGNNGTGGQGLGGQGWIDAFGANVTIGGDYDIDVSGYGGSGNNSGFGRGGNAYLASSSTLLLTGNAYLTADGRGGGAFSGNAANGQGGFVNVRATGGGTLTVQGDVDAHATGEGGFVGFGSGTAGDGDGGTISIHAGNGGATPSGGTLNILGGLTAVSDGIGGLADTATSVGGTGRGAELYLFAAGGGDLSVGGGTNLSADGLAGDFGECFDCGGTPGIGDGGNLNINADGAGSTLTFGDDLVATADGEGGLSSTDGGAGGYGEGGLAGMTAGNGGTITATYVEISATGTGGFDDNGVGGGNGKGGNVYFNINGTGASAITVSGPVYLDASGYGGDSFGGNGGTGTGGVAGSYVPVGTVTVGSLSISARGEGGTVIEGAGTGGDATGGSVRLQAAGGDILVNGNLAMDGSATGGYGTVGGNAVALADLSPDETNPIAAGIYATGDGTVTVNGATVIDGSATGGTGSAGNGGNATAGEIDIVAFFGDITLGDLDVDISGTGGDGGLGGNGGFGQGGYADLTFGLGAAAIGGTITFGTTTVIADGTGGDGGAGIDGNTGGDGGAGGAGTGGRIGFAGIAAGGTLNSGITVLSAQGHGGAGGAGGNGDSGTGGNGGAGGSATGGGVQTGTNSAAAAPGTGGGFNLPSLFATTSAAGGAGGAGGLGGGGNGTGGNGGDAVGGASGFLIRGVTSNVGSITLQANATGGNGGAGGGNGGNATTGVIRVESKDRFGHPNQRGTLIASSITGTAIATGGLGSGGLDGSSTVYGGSYFRVLNGDATIGSVNIIISGDLYIDGIDGSDWVSVRDGTANIGSFSYSTTGELALDANNGSMDANTIALSAGTFVAHTFDPAPTVLGTYFADTFDITTDGDFITNANLDSVNIVDITAPGSITAVNIDSDAEIYLNAQSGSVTVNDLTATGEIRLDAATDITTNDLTTGSYILANAGEDLMIGDAVSADSTDLSGATVTYATINSGAETSLSSNGLIQGGNITAVGPISAYTAGSIELGILSSGSNIDLLSYEGNIDILDASAGGYIDLRTFLIVEGSPLVGGSIEAGDLTADEYVFIQSGTTVLTGDIAALQNVQILVGTNGLTGAITAGTDVTAQANGTLGLGLITAGGNVLAESTGAMTLEDIAVGGNVEVNSSTSIAAQDITADGEIRSRNSGASNFGSLVAGTDVNVGSIGALTFASAEAGEIVRIGSDASITGGNVTAGDSIVASAAGNISLGNLSAGLVNPSTSNGALYEVALMSTGVISTLDIDATGDVQLASAGGISTGDATTTERMFAISDGPIVLGDVSTGGQLLVGGYQLQYTGTIHVDSTFDARPTFNALLDPNAPNVTIGSINAGSVEINAATLVLGAISSTDFIDLLATGNITFASATAGGEFDFNAGGNVTGGNVTAGDELGGNAQGSIILGNLTAGLPVDDDFSVGLLAVGNITIGNVVADGPVGLATQGNLATGTIDAGEGIMALVGGNTTMAGVTTTGTGGGQVYIGDDSMLVLGGGTWDGEGDFDPSIVLAQFPIATGGSITINGPISTGLFRVAAGTTFTTGDLGSGSFEILADAIDVGDIITSDPVALSAASGISTGNIQTDSYVNLFSSNGSIDTGDIDSGSYIALDAGGNVTTGDLFAGSSVTIDAGGSVSTGDIEAGLGGVVALVDGIGTMDVGPGNSVEIFSDASIDTGDISTDGYVGLYAANNIAVGAVTAEHDVIALAGGAASFGAINTPERFILAGYGNFDELQGIEFFDPELIFSTFPIDATGGNATFAGESNVAQFEAYVGGSTTIESVTANGEFSSWISVETGGLLAINGTVDGGYVRLLSGDIAIGAAATINAAEGISFISINGDGTYLGDGLSGTDGYRLTQAELDRVNANAFEFEAQVDRGASDLMILGDLEFDIQTSGDEDVVEFGIQDDGEQENAVGTIRVVGDVLFTLGADKGVEFSSNTFEIDAETGSVSLLDSNGNLTGTLDIEAENIFIASGEILARLEENPQYEGFREDLNAPAAVQRPEGVVRAAVVTLNEDDSVLRNILIQNTGTDELPAGFLINELSLIGDSDEGSTPEPGSINMVINGQIETTEGTLTGDDVRAAFVEEFGTEIFVADSTINGCTLTGDCSSFTPEEQIPPAAVVTPTTVAILTADPIGEMDFGNEGDIDDSVENDGSDLTSPIEAPQPLFDTRPLDGDEDVNEPISGAGNPSLYGVTSDEDDEEDEDDNGGKEVKPAGQTDGRTGGGQ